MRLGTRYTFICAALYMNQTQLRGANHSPLFSTFDIIQYLRQHWNAFRHQKFGRLHYSSRSDSQYFEQLCLIHWARHMESPPGYRMHNYNMCRKRRPSGKGMPVKKREILHYKLSLQTLPNPQRYPAEWLLPRSALHFNKKEEKRKRRNKNSHLLCFSSS